MRCKAASIATTSEPYDVLPPAACAATALAIGASFVSAAPLDLHDGDRVQPGWGTNHGTTGAGAFTASGVGVAGDSFLTFCLERTECASLNTPCYAQIDAATRKGGKVAPDAYSSGMPKRA